MGSIPYEAGLVLLWCRIFGHFLTNFGPSSENCSPFCIYHLMNKDVLFLPPKIYILSRLHFKLAFKFNLEASLRKHSNTMPWCDSNEDL